MYLICVECRYELEIVHINTQGGCPNCGAIIGVDNSILKLTFNTLGESLLKRNQIDKVFVNPCPEYTPT